MRLKILATIVLMTFMLNGFATDVGVIDTKGKFSDIDRIIAMVESLGHNASILPESKILRPTGLNHYDCIILSHRNGVLRESEYKALAEYVVDGGVLLITGLAAYWMNVSENNKKHRRIAGEGPLKSVTGIKMTGAREAAIIKLTLLEETSLTEGLPKTFTLETRPSFNANDPKSWSGIGAYPIKAVTAKTLIEVETRDVKGNTGKRDLLTVNPCGEGKCIWLACRLSPAILERKEAHVTRILSNILSSSEWKR